MQTTRTLKVKKGASTATDARLAARELHEAIIQPDIALAIFYCSPDYDLDVLGPELGELFAGIPLIGCTTAGEISTLGYVEGSLTGVSISSEGFRVATTRIDGLQDYEFADGENAARKLLEELSEPATPVDDTNTFGLLLIDGLSMQEESVVSSLSQSLGSIQLFGGSAGDGVRFAKTHLYHDGAFHSDCALFNLVSTDHPFEVFKTQHFVESEEKIVVTQADPSRRIVTEINGEPAGREYARMVGLDVDKLSPMIFASHPVVVRVGGSYFVRSIQKVNDDESLTLFCAIDEGIVLTVARRLDLVDNLRQQFRELKTKLGGTPSLVLGCDCILRHLEVQRDGLLGDVGRIMTENNVIGFSTYGEQYNGMHVNQTFTGVAIGSMK